MSLFSFVRLWDGQPVMTFYGVFVKLRTTERACGQVGHLKRLCPNVRRYKLLILNYLLMFKRFPSAETKVQKNYCCSITFVRPTCHKPMLCVVIHLRVVSRLQTLIVDLFVNTHVVVLSNK